MITTRTDSSGRDRVELALQIASIASDKALKAAGGSGQRDTPRAPDFAR